MFAYDIAISFADEDRKLALELANLLNESYKVKVFYDDYEQAKIVGEDLLPYLEDIYKNKALYCLVLISKHYREKRWTRHEWRAAQLRAFEQPGIKYIIPVRIDETELPGLLPTVYALHTKNLTIQKIADTIFNMVKEEVEKLKMIRVAQGYYAKGEFAKALYLVNDEIFDENIEALRIRGDAYGKLHQYNKGIKAFEKIVELIPNDFLARFLLGIFYYRIGDFENSVKNYEAAENIYPNHPTILSDLPAARRRLKTGKGLLFFFNKIVKFF
jgi:tetratricopeptide (TPR) repeat protein